MDPLIEKLKSTTFFGRRFSRRQIAEVQQMVATFPALSRKELAQTICEHLHWHTPSGGNRSRPRWGLSGTRLARAQCGTIRLKLLKIGVRIRVSVRAVRLSFDEGFPEAGLFGQVLARLQSLPLRC